MKLGPEAAPLSEPRLLSRLMPSMLGMWISLIATRMSGVVRRIASASSPLNAVRTVIAFSLQHRAVPQHHRGIVIYNQDATLRRIFISTHAGAAISSVVS